MEEGAVKGALARRLLVRIPGHSRTPLTEWPRPFHCSSAPITASESVTSQNDVNSGLRNTDVDTMTSWSSPPPIGSEPLRCVFPVYVELLCLLLFLLYQEPISGSTCRQHDGNKLSVRMKNKTRLTSCFRTWEMSMHWKLTLHKWKKNITHTEDKI